MVPTIRKRRVIVRVLSSLLLRQILQCNRRGEWPGADDDVGRAHEWSICGAGGKGARG